MIELADGRLQRAAPTVTSARTLIFTQLRFGSACGSRVAGMAWVFVQDVIYNPLMDYKTLATILFRVLGLAYFVFAIFYAPSLLFPASYSGTFLISGLGIMT